MKICEILFYFFVLDSIFSETQIFKQVKQVSAQRSLHVQAQEKYVQQMSDLMEVRAEQLKLDRSLIDRDIQRIKKDPIFKHKGVYGVIPIGKSGRLKVVHNIDKVVNKRPAKLTKEIQNRFLTREPNPGQQKCGLWMQVANMEYYPGFKQARGKIVLRSNCTSGPEIKYFLLRNQSYIPEYLQFKIGDKTFRIKYDKRSFRSYGYGTSMRQMFTRYKLQSFFKIRYRLTRAQKEDIRRQQIEQNKQKCMDRCQFQRGHNRTICYQRCQLRHRYVPRRNRYLLQTSEKEQNDKQNQENTQNQKQETEQVQKSIHLEAGRTLEEKIESKNTENVQDQQKSSENQEKQVERNLKLKQSQENKKKDRELHKLCDCRYCHRKRFAIERNYCLRACNARCDNAQAELNSSDRNTLHVQYKSTLSVDEIISPGSHENQRGFFDYSIVDAIWNSPAVVNANATYEHEKSMHMVQGHHRGRPTIKRELRRRCIMQGALA